MGQPEKLYTALSEERRWLALQCIREHRTIALADLAELVAEAEEGEDVQEIPEEEVRNVYVSLYHVHVPLLAEVDLAQYDQERDLVAVTDRTESILDSVADQLRELRGTRGQETSS